MTQSIIWQDGRLRLLNQTLLPNEVKYIDTDQWEVVAEAIKRLEVRGAPAIGAAAAFGLVLGGKSLIDNSQDFFKDLSAIAQALRATRPTAVNLFWALDRMMSVVSRFETTTDPKLIVDELTKEAVAIAEVDKNVNQNISSHGAKLFTGPAAVLTHCNAGALATVAFGTALGVIRQAWADGKITRVFADETRPLLQGARLTAWELQQEGIPVTLITDNMAGWVMKNKMVSAVIVGADRIARNGDVANKIGTYSVAVLAQKHNIPFYVAAPVSTFDFTIATGDEIPIEERSAGEVRAFGGCNTAPQTVDVFNPAFDVTPNELVTAIITEHGILRAPYTAAIENLTTLVKSRT